MNYKEEWGNLKEWLDESLNFIKKEIVQEKKKEEMGKPNSFSRMKNKMIGFQIVQEQMKLVEESYKDK